MQAKDCDVDSWQRCLEAGLLDGNLSAEPPGKLTLNNVLQFSKLAQFGLQLLYQSVQDGGDAAALQAENRVGSSLTLLQLDTAALPPSRAHDSNPPTSHLTRCSLCRNCGQRPRQRPR